MAAKLEREVAGVRTKNAVQDVRLDNLEEGAIMLTADVSRIKKILLVIGGFVSGAAIDGALQWVLPLLLAL